MREMQKTSNENKMSDGGRERASLGVEVWKSSQKWSAQRSAVRSIAWLDALAWTSTMSASSAAKLRDDCVQSNVPTKSPTTIETQPPARKRELQDRLQCALE